MTAKDQRQVLSIGQIDEFRPLLIATQIPVPFSDDWGLQIDGAHEFARAIESATLAALTQQAQEPVGDRYFSYSTDMGFEEFATQQEAIDCSNVQINGYREDAIRDDEWPDEVDSVCWGVILGRSREIDTSNEDHESVDYKLYTTPPAPQVPAKCLTCSGHGEIGGHMPDGSGHGEPCPACNAPQVPAPVDERAAFDAAFSLVFEAYAKPADNFNSHEEWAIWQHGKVIKAFGLLQRFRAALQSPAPQTKGGEA